MRGSSTLCSAVARGRRLKVWNTNPISLLRMRASASSSRSETFWALSQYSPDVGVSRQPIKFISVDLPDPDGPMTATYSFCLICRLTPCSARTTSPPMSYARVSLCVRMTMSGSGDDPGRGGEIGADVGGRLVEGDLDLIIHRPVVLPGGAGGRVAHARVGHLGDAADEHRIRERVDRHLDRVAEVDAHHVRLVHLDLGLDHGEIGDGQQQADVLREGARHRYLTLLHRQPRHPTRHRSD